MTYSFGRPIRKTGFFYVPMSPIEVIVPEAIVELCQPVAGRGILISLYLSEHSAAARKKIDDLDEGVMAEVERHNEEWFSNRLDS